MYLNFCQPRLKAGVTREFTIMMVNDDARPIHGRLTLSLETKYGNKMARAEQTFAIDELGSKTYHVSLAIPQQAGDCVLKAVASPDDHDREATVCRRWTSVAD